MYVLRWVYFLQSAEEINVQTHNKLTLYNYLLDRSDLGMIHLKIKDKQLQTPFTVTYSSSPPKNPNSNNISTSPHSVHSPHMKKANFFRLNLTSTENISSTDSLFGEIKINLYDHFCVLDCSEGEKSIAKLQKILEEWGASRRTKINVKLLVSHKLAECNPRLKYIFDLTVREYEQYYKQVE